MVDSASEAAQQMGDNRTKPGRESRTAYDADTEAAWPNCNGASPSVLFAGSSAAWDLGSG